MGMVSIEDGDEEDNLVGQPVGVKAWSIRQIQKERLGPDRLRNILILG